MSWSRPSRERSPLSAAQGTRARRPWPSSGRLPWTVACIVVPSKTSTARPPLTSASAPRVSVLLLGSWGWAGLVGGSTVLGRDGVLPGQTARRQRFPLFLHIVLSGFISREEGEGMLPLGVGGWAFTPVLSFAGFPSLGVHNPS